ncbi:MAG: TonB-dependent receptor [Gammaproteobacteria bacterium]|nr:TonB-dependent receptor [Gammaproteobacteria bacterium]
MYRIAQAVVFSLTVAPAHGQAPNGSDEAAIEEVVVVGTRRASRDVHGLAVPVDVLDYEELNTQGDGDILDALASLVPSYNVAREPISDAATLIRPANMRGLPADNTLVLVNGKRRHRGAVIGEFVSGINKGAQAVDIVPLAGIALKQVEVLRNGASAQYGSDAVAGVMNFVLEDDPDAGRLQAQYGSTFVGDGNQIMLSGAFGTDVGSDGFATLSFELKDSAPTSRGSQDPQATYLVENGYTDIADPVVIWGSPDIEGDFKVIVNTNIQSVIGELYGFGIWSAREVDGSFYYRNPNTRKGVFADASGDNLLVADLTPDDDMPCRNVPVGGSLADPDARNAVMADPNCFVFTEWFPGGFTPRFGGEVGDASLAVGWRGTRTGGLNYDFSVSAGRNEIVYRIRNTVNASYGPNSPVAFDLGSQIQFERLVNADFTWPVDVGAASDLNVAFGMQHHKEVFEMVAGDTESWAPGGFENQGFSVGSNGFQGFSADVAGKFNRESVSAYVDLSVDMTERWLADAALRYERFSDFGSTASWRAVSTLQRALPCGSRSARVFALRPSGRAVFDAPPR